MSRWWTYLKERSPIPALSILAAGLVISGQSFAHRRDGILGLLGFLGILALLIYMRLADELKDFAKDRVTHPERPLPRGLVTPREIQGAMSAVIALNLGLALAGGLIGDPLGAVGLLAAQVWAWLMYKEFFIGARLARFPMAYALSHQVIVFPLYGFATAFLGRELVADPVYLLYLTMNFGASMTFEICRKLDPAAHPLQGTYLHAYGPRRTAALVAAFVAISLAAARGAGLAAIAWPLELATLAAVPLIVIRPSQFKSLEGLSLLNALISIWALAIAALIHRGGP